MYFSPATNTGLNLGWRDMSAYFRPLSSSVYVVVLRKDLPSPILPESDEEKPAEQQEKAKAGVTRRKEKKTEIAAPVRIDVDGMAQRSSRCPFPARN